VEASAAAERAALEHRAESEREALVVAAKAAASAQAAGFLRMSALPLSWAVRRELQEKDFREIAMYFQQLVGLAGVRRVALVLPDGRIKVASDQKIEGRPAPEVFPDAALENDAPAVRPAGASGLEAVVPIMGLNSRLATLVVDYEPAPADRPPAP
jgi:hypothetical protein